MDRGIGTQVTLYIEVYRVITGGFGCDFKEVLSEVVGFKSAEVPIQDAAPQRVPSKLDEGVVTPTHR